MVVSTQPTQTVSGQPIAGHPAVEVRDASNDPVGTGTEVTVTINKSSFTGASILTTTTNASGIATFDNLILEIADTGYQLTFSSDGLTDATSDEFEVVPAAPYNMTITQQPENNLQERAIAGPPTVTLFDEFGNTITGVDITVSLNQNSFSGGDYTIATNGNGEAIFSNLTLDVFASGYEITFNADASGVADITSDPFEIYEEQYTITIQNQPIHSVADDPILGTEIVNPIRVRIADMADNPVASGTVYVTPGKGSFTGGSTTSASVSGGIAIFDNLIIDVADTDYQLIFSNPSVHIANVASDTFDVVTEGATMTMDVNTTESIEGIPLYGPPTIYIEDNGPVVGEVITAYLNKNDFTGGSTITATTDGDGRAVFDDLIIDDIADEYQIFFKASTPGIATITSSAFDVREEVAIMAVTRQPELSIAGETLNGVPTVSITEKLTGNPALAQIRVSLNNGYFNPSSDTLINTVSGVAEFNNLIVDTPGDYTLTYSVPGASGIDTVMTVEFEVLAIAGNLTITTQPQESLEGYPLNGLPTVTILDIDGITPTEGIPVTAILNKSGFASGESTVSTNASGQAIFDDLVIADIDTDYTITFDVPVSSGVVGKTSNAFEVVEEFALLSVEVQPTLTIDGEVINGQPTVKITNKSSGLPMNNTDIYVSLSKNSFSSGTLTRKTNAEGIAVFDDLVVDTPDDDYQIIFSTQTTNVANINTDAFNVIPVAGTMTITTQPVESIEGYTLEGPPTIRILDPFDAPLSGIQVTAVLSDNDFAVGSITQLNTDIDGYATFNNLTIDDVADGYNITFDVALSDGVVSKTSDAFDVVEEVALLSINQQPALTIAGETINGPPSLLIVNKSTGNPIPSINIYVSLNKDNFSGSSTMMATTNASGIATFENLIIDDDDTDYQLTYSTQSSGIADIVSDNFDVIPVTGEITIVQQPQETVNGYAIAGPPTIAVNDLGDNPIGGVDVTAVINKNSISGGTVTRTTNGDGTVTFDDLILSDVSTGYELTFTVDVGEGILNKTSDEFRMVAEVAIIEITQEPTLTIAGELINGPPAVLLKNPGGDPITGGNITVSLSKNDFVVGSTTTATTNASGIAVFDNLSVNTTDTDYQLIFSTISSGIANQTSVSFDVVEPEGLLAITQQPLETVYGHPIFGPPTVRVTENDGTTPKQGIAVTASVNKNGFSSGTTTVGTDVNGYAVFDDLIINAIASGYQLTFNTDISERIANKTSDSFDVVAVAGYLNVSTQPTGTVEGDPINGPPVVRLTNLASQGVSGVTISVALNKNDFTGGSTISAVTNSTGYATFNNLIIDDFDTGYSLTFEAIGASGVAPVTSDVFEVTDVSLTMDILQQPEETVAGVSITPAPQVHIYNGVGNIEGAVVTAYLSKNSYSSGSTLTATTNSSGIATFSNLIINTADAGYTITFNADYSGVRNANSNAFTITPAPANYIEVTSQPQNTTAGEAVEGQPAATAYDEFGNPVPGVEIDVEPNQNTGSFSGTTPVTTDENGVATFNDLIITTSAPNYQLFFTASGVATGSSSNFIISNAAPDNISIITQPTETVAGAAISGPPEIVVEDEYGNPVQGETVTISTIEGYTIDAGTLGLETPANGVVAFSDLVINAVGTYSFRFDVDGVEATSAYFSVLQGTISPRYFGGSHSGFISFNQEDIPLGQSPARIEVITHPMESVVGDEITGPPRVVVYDVVDNPIPNVSVTVTGAAFSAGVETLNTDTNGEATFTGLAIDAAGTYTLTFTADDYPGVFISSDPFDVIDPIAAMSLSIQPQQTMAGQAVAGHPAVLLLNSIGMPVPDVDITVYINQHNFGGGSVTTVTTGANGLAEFDELFLTNVASGYQLIFDADYSGVLNTTSNPFNVISGPVHSITVTTQPRETLEGATLSGPPAATVYDEYGNTMAGVSVTVTEVLEGVSFDAGITTLTTNSAGVASFSTLVLNSRGTYQLSFEVSGIPTVTSGTFQVVSGTVANRFRGSSHSGFTALMTQDKLLGQIPTRMEVTNHPTETVAGFVVEGPPSIRVYDEIDNPVAGVQVTVSVLDGGSFSYGTYTRITNDQGEISFNDLVISEQGTFKLNFSADNHTATVSDEQSNPFNVIGQVYLMEVVSQPQNSIAGETITGPPVVTITNFIYQPLAGVDVTVYINQHGLASGSYTVPTNIDGEAVFDDLIINTAASGYQLIFDANYPGIANETSETFSVSNAPPSNISIITQPGTSIAGSAIAGPPAVRLSDEFGNPVDGETISIIETGGYTFDAGTTSLQTDPSGYVIFNDLIISTIGQYGITFTANDVDDAVSMPFSVTSGTVANRFFGSSHSGFVSTETNDKALGQTPARIEITSQPQETVLGDIGGVYGPPTIRVYDDMDNPMSGVWVNVTASGAGFSGGTTNLASAADGTISYAGLMIDIAGTYQLSFIAQDYPSISANSATFDVVSPNLFMTMQNQPAETIAGQPVAGHPAVKLANGIGQGFEGIDVTVFINQHSFASAPATQTVTTDAGGLAVFDQLVLNVAASGYQLIFNADYAGVINLTSGDFSVIPADPDVIGITQQPQDTDAGSTIPGPPSVRITDEYSNVIPGISIAVAETGGYIFDAGNISQNTNATGIATFPDLLINDQGQYSLTFSAAGVSDVVSMNFNVRSGTVSNRFKGNSHSGFTTQVTENQPLGQTPSRIEVLIQPVETIVGMEIEGPPRIVVYDETDRPMGGVYVSVTTSQPFTAASNDQLITDTNGEILWDNLFIETPGTYTLTFTVDFYTPVVSTQSAQFDVISPQLFLTIPVQPGETVAGQTIAGPPSVRLATALNQGQEGVDITVYVNQSSFASAPEAQTVTTDAQGYAEFDQLVINTAATGYQLIFDADISGVVNITSDAFNVVNAVPDSMTVTTQPVDTENGAVIAGPPAVTVYDDFGNALPGITVSVSETGGYIFPGGTLTQTTDANGVAAFNNLLMEDIGTYSLTFNVAGIDNIVSNTFRVFSGNVFNRFKGNSHSGFISDTIDDVRLGQQPTHTAILMQPQETIAGDAIEGPPVLVVYDEMDNPVAGITINVFIAGAGGPAFAAGSTTQLLTDLNGEAEFANLIVEVTGTFTLRFNVDGYGGIIPDAISQSFEVVDPLLKMQITEQPTVTTAGEVITGPPTVRITTAGAVQQPFGGVAVTAYINQNSFASGTQTVSTNDQGYAIFDDLVIETAASGYQLIFESNYSGVANQISDAFSVVAAPASQMNIVTQPVDAQSNAIIGGPPTIALYDTYNNPVQGVNITLTEQGGYIFDGGTTTQTSGANGYASFSDLMISTPGYYTLNFDATTGGVPDTQSQQFRILSNDLLGRFRGASHSGFIMEEEENVLLKQIPTYIEVLTQPSQTELGEPVQGFPQIAVYDQLYQPVINTVVMVSVVGGTVPAMSGDMSISTDENGRATFDNLIVQEIKEHRLYFEVGGHNNVNITSQYFEVIAPMYTMAMHIQPADNQAGNIMVGDPSGFPAVIITDGLGNGVNNIEVSVYLNQYTFASDPAFATAITNGLGIAIFDNLSINHAAENYQMLFEATTAGINSVTSGTFTILPGPAFSLTISTQPQSSFSGAAIEGPPAAALYDEFNNPVEGATVTVSETGLEPLIGTTSVLTNTSGIALFSNITIDNPDTYQLVFDNTDVDPVTSFSFTVSSSEITGRFRGSTHSGFTSELIEDVPLYIPDAVEVPVFVDPVTEMCEGTTETFTATAEHSDSLKYSINPAAFGTINEDTGVLTLHMGYHGTLYVIGTAYGHEGPVRDSVEVTVNSEVDLPQFDDPVYFVCQGVDETIQYTATTVQESIIDYYVEPVETGSISSITGLMTWDPGFSGEANIYAQAEATNGCGSVKENFVTVTVNPEIGDPVFTQGAVEVCQDAPNETYLAISTNAEDITYSLSDGTAGILHPTTGVMNWDAGFHGTVTIAAIATGCGGSKTIDRVVTVHSLPPTSAITGNSSAVCNAVGEVYSVELNAGSNYQWTVPTGAVITSGSIGPENNNITVDFGENNGYITVVETDIRGCIGTPVNLLVTLEGCGMQADFDASSANICEGGSITYTDLSTGGALIDGRTWSFGAGASPSGANTQGPHTVTYLNEGTYTVSLTVTDGIASDTHSIEINVSRRGRWLGTVDDDWFNAANWSCGILPTNSIDVTIPGGVTNNPIISMGNADVRNITIENGGQLTINNSTLNVHGNWFNNGTFNAGGTVSFHSNTASIAGIAVTTFHNLRIVNTAELTAPSSNMNIQGNLIVEGIFTHNNGTVSFTGGAMQEISGSASSLVLRNLTVNKSAGTLTLQRHVDVSSYLTLTQGIIYTSDASLLRIMPGANSDEGSDASHIDGPVVRTGSTAFIFPTGNSGVWAPIGISAPGAGAEVFRAQYFYQGHLEAGEDPCTNCEDSIQVVSDVEYWDMRRLGGSSTPNVTMYFKDMGRSGISIGNLIYGHWSGGSWSDHTLEGSGTLDGTGGCYITGTGFSTYNIHAPAKSFEEDLCSAEMSLVSPLAGIVCDGELFTLQVVFTGEAPFSFTYTDGTNTYTESDISDNPYEFSRNAVWQGPDPTRVNTYTITSMSDNTGCTQPGTGLAEITINQLPTVTFDAVPPVCVDAPAFDLTQGSPAGGTYSGTGITTSPQFSPATAGPGTHTITYTYTDANGCVNSADRDITVNALPGPVVSGPVDICSPGTGIFSTTLNADHSYVWTVSGGTITAGAGTNQITVEFSTTGTAEIQVTETNDITGCSATSTLYEVTVHETPIINEIESSNSLKRR